MFCSNCGSRLEEGKRFCSNCGSPAQATAGAVMTNAPPLNTINVPPPPEPAYTPPPPQYTPPPPQYAPPPPQDEPERSFPIPPKILIPAASALVILAVFLGLFFFTDLFSPSTGGNGGGTIAGDREDNRDGDSRGDLRPGSNSTAPLPFPPRPPYRPLTPPPQSAPVLSRAGGQVRVTETTDFEFTPGESGIWEIRTSNNGGSDPTLWVHDSAGFSVGYDDDSGGDFNALLFLHLEAGHTYTITAGFFHGDGSGSYILTVSPGTAPVFYQEYLYEGSVTINERTSFTFYPSQSGIWEFVTSENGGGDPYLEIFGPQGFITSDDDSGVGLNAHLTVYLEVGVQYTLTAGYFASWTVDSYLLTSSFVDGSAISLGGTVHSEVFYKDLAISRIFDEALEYTLGEPIISNSPFYSYEGLEIYYMPGRVHSVHGTLPGMFTISGVTLDKTREQIIAFLGSPIEYFVYPESPDYPYVAEDNKQQMRYHVSSYILDYIMDFWFYDQDSIPSTIAFVPMVPRM